MLNNPALSDVQIVVKETTFFAHQVVLACRSSYFRGLLCAGAMGVSGGRKDCVFVFVITGEQSAVYTPILNTNQPGAGS